MTGKKDKLVLSIVIPAYNEERAIVGVLDDLKLASRRVVAESGRVEEVEILVVDDGSKDKTYDLAAGVEGVKVIRHQVNGGYGKALKTGCREARGDWLLFLDADGTYPAGFVIDLVREMEKTGADIVLGSRLADPDSGMPAVRRAGNVFFARLLSWITGRRITDTASGMRIFKRQVVRQLDPLPDGLDFTPAMSTSALHRLLDIREIPMPYKERIGDSKLNPVTDGLRFLWTILRTAHRYNPLKIFGVLGLLCLAGALVLGLGPLVYYLEVGRVEDWEIYRLVTVIVLAVSGLNIIFFGVVSNMIMATVHRLPPYRNSLLGRLLLRPLVLKYLWLLGVILMLSAPALNFQGLYSFFTSGKVYLHWSYVVTGSMLFLLGLSLTLWGSIVRAVEHARLGFERDGRAAVPPEGDR